MPIYHVIVLMETFFSHQITNNGHNIVIHLDDQRVDLWGSYGAVCGCPVMNHEPRTMHRYAGPLIPVRSFINHETVSNAMNADEPGTLFVLNLAFETDPLWRNLDFENSYFVARRMCLRSAAIESSLESDQSDKFHS